MNWIEWDEPSVDGDNVHCRITETEALNRQRASMATKGYVEVNDSIVLEDFLTLHWAWITTDEN